MMKKILLAFALILPLQTLSAADAAVVLQEKLNQIKTMSAKFSQQVSAKRRVLSNSSGSMALLRPGKFRWDTKEPMPQLIVADGKKMWIYDVDLEQVTIKKQEKSIGGTAALFLSGYSDSVARDYKVSQKQNGARLEFDMKAKDQEHGFKRIKMTFDKNTLVAMELYDQLGQVTQVKLKQIKINPKLSSSLFQFKPPAGVDIIKQ